MIVAKYKQNLKLLFFVLLIIGNSGYMLQVADKNFNRIISGIIITVGGIIGIKLLTIKRININKMEYRVVLSFIVLNIMTMLANLEISMIYLKYISLVLIAFYFVEQQTTEKTISLLINVMVVLSIISLLFMLIVLFYGKISPISIVSTGNSNVEYYNYFIFFYPNLFKNLMFRNQGIFWEPGLYASYLLIALMLEITFSKNIRIWKIMILLITIFTTSSTAGIMILPLIILLYIERYIVKTQVSFLLVLITLNIIIIGYIFKDIIIQYLVIFSPKLFLKLLENGTTKVTRINSPLLNLSIFSEYPLFGAGYLRATEIFELEKAKYYIDAQTSTNFFMLASLGVFGIFYTIWWGKSIFTNKFLSFFSKILIFLVIFIILNKEPHNELLLTWVILFLLIKIRRKKDYT